MTASQSPVDLAARVAADARRLGVDEVVVTVSRSTNTSIIRRDGRVEQATEATSYGLSFSVFKDERYSSHSTSDLRPEAIDTFLRRTISATKWLEPDPDRRLAESERCGRGMPPHALEQLDEAVLERTADDRGAHARDLEREVTERLPKDAISASVSVADGSSESARVMSNGFSDLHSEAWISAGGELALRDGERRPEAYTGFATRFVSDLPDPVAIADELIQRAVERRGSGPIASGRYSLLLPNRIAGRILGMLGGPLSGSALHQCRSCLQGRLGSPIASPLLTITDDPALPRGLSSRPWDGDGLTARRFTIVEEGVLQAYYISVYYGRKLEQEPTTGSRSNWIVRPGNRSWQTILGELPSVIVVDGFLGGNSNPVTGDFSLGIQGSLYRNGERIRALSEMNMAGNLLELLAHLVEVGDEPYLYSSVRCPWLRFEDVQFSGT